MNTDKDRNMTGKERRFQILSLLRDSGEAMTGSDMAKHFGVSRQVIVQDMALLKTSNQNILSTTKGYILLSSRKAKRIFKVLHTDSEIADELTAIIDLGGCVLDVFVDHSTYGKISVPLGIYSAKDIISLVESIAAGKSQPLKNVTSGYHFHTVEAASEDVLDMIEAALRRKNYLVD